MSGGLASPWILGTFLLQSSSLPTEFSSLATCGGGAVCRSHFRPPKDLKFVLHDALDSSGFNTTYAREAREGFCSQIKKLSKIERETSISINGEVDLGKTALYIAAEDDSLISHSSVPLPVDAFIGRLDDLSTGYCSRYNSSFTSSPDMFLECLERYMYVDKGFRRTKSSNHLEHRAVYLHSVLTHRVGSMSMLSLIYSEVLKMLRLWGLLKFDVEVSSPNDSYGSPRGYLKHKTTESDQQQIVTTEFLLLKILRDLKDAFWPFQLDQSKSPFLRAAEAAHCSDRSANVDKSGLELASAKAARHRLERGVWTSVRFGDIRRALSACERRLSSLSTVRVEHDNAGMLALNLSSKPCHTLQFGFVNEKTNNITKGSNKKNSEFSGENNEAESDDDDSVKKRHSDLREVHRAVFDEQVFNLINQEAFVPSFGVNVTGIRENHLQLNIDQEASVFISLVTSSSTEDDATHSFEGEEKHKQSFLHNRISSEILLKQLFHEHVFVRAKNRSLIGQPPKDGLNLLSHFCMSLAHRIFSSKVLTKLDDLARSVSYVRLMSHPTWHSRTSTWTLVVDVPQSILHTSFYMASSSQFLTKVVVNDDCINIEGEGAPNVVGLFKGKSENSYSINRFECNLADLHVILLQQVGSQIIRWLHEEALTVGMKATRDFLSLSFEVGQGEVVGLVAQVDPEDSEGGISWWLVVGNEAAEEYKLQREDLDGETKRFLGHLSLDVLYATLLDLVTMCNNNGGSL